MMMIIVLPVLFLLSCVAVNGDTGAAGEPKEAKDIGAQMTLPRCGGHDVSSDDASSDDVGSRTFAAGSKVKGWEKKTTLTYKFLTITTDMSITRQRAAIERALFKWSDVTPLEFRLTDGRADIEFTFYAYSRSGYRTFDGPSGMLSDSRFYSSKLGESIARVNFDDSEMWLSNIVPREWRCHHAHNKNDGCCTQANPCTEGDGDCDNDKDCTGNMRCGKNNCDMLSRFDRNDDCCTLPNYNLRCSGKDEGCCTKARPCNEREGDCDGGSSSNECHGGLACGNNNCYGEGFDYFDDCCMEPKYGWYRGILLEWAALHQIGHVLGLSHSNEKSSVMYEHYDGKNKFELSSNDIANVQKIWGRDTCRITHERACSNLESDGLRISTHTDGIYKRFDCAMLCKQTAGCGGFQLGRSDANAGHCVLMKAGCIVMANSRAYDWNYFDIDTCECWENGTFVKKWDGRCHDPNLVIPSSITGSVQQCIDYCRKDSNCVAFEYKTNTRECSKYKTGCRMSEMDGFGFYRLQECPVDGGWSAWKGWSSCNRSCGGGWSMRRRSCDSPVPRGGGKECVGPPFERVKCNVQKC